MRYFMTLLLLFSLLCLPTQSFARQSAGRPAVSSQENDPCDAGNLPVIIKLTGGGKIEGGLLEKTAESITVCEKGKTRVIETRKVSRLKTRMTGDQRLKHSLKVIGIFFTVSVIFSYLRYRANT